MGLDGNMWQCSKCKEYSFESDGRCYICYPKTTFLISPVRGVDQAQNKATVEMLERQGFKVHWPHRDTNQNDGVGLRICLDNLAAIKESEYVHVIWDGKSHGCLFDAGMAFALGKKIVPLNLPEETDHKSFQNMLRAHASRDI